VSKISAPKKGFVLYFDACQSLRALNPTQRGYLLTALCDYAEADARSSLPPEHAVEHHPELDKDTHMAFLFMASAIYRDTEKWRAKQERARAAAFEHLRTLKNPDLSPDSATPAVLTLADTAQEDRA